jgi:hypothetical protein
MVRLDVLLEERAIRRVPVDVTLFDVDVLLLQKTSGVSARRSGGFPVEGCLGHADIIPDFGLFARQPSGSSGDSRVAVFHHGGTEKRRPFLL